MQTVLITGGAGFIGANFISYFLDTNPNFQVVNLDKLTYAADVNNLIEVADNQRYIFVEGDICDRNLVEKLFHQYNFNGVIHFAAESHVDNSIKNPDAFIKTNVFGTFVLLDVAKNFWMTNSNQTKNYSQQPRFHHISTDEVYGALGETGFFTEETPYAPNSPYSASKAASDMLVRSYFHTFGMNVVTTNCSNNYGPKQHDEKLIPTIIRKALSGENIPIYGDGKNVRDWLHVLDHCRALELVFRNGKAGETYAIGANSEHTNLYIADKICSILDEMYTKETSYKDQITFVSDRLGHDFRYAIDATKIKNELHWEPTETFNNGLRNTIAWYVKKYTN